MVACDRLGRRLKVIEKHFVKPLEEFIQGQDKNNVTRTRSNHSQAEEATRLTEYLLRLATLRTKLIRDIAEYERVLWVSSVPKKAWTIEWFAKNLTRGNPSLLAIKQVEALHEKLEKRR